MGILDSIGSALSDVGSSIVSGVGSFFGTEGVIPGLIAGGMPLIAGLFADDPQQPFANTQEAFEASQALALQKIETEAAIAREQMAAQLEMAGIAADKALKAAEIAAGAQKFAAKQALKGSLIQTKERALAQGLAAKIQAARGRPELIQQARQGVAQAILARGAMGQQGFGQVTQAIQRGI